MVSTSYGYSGPSCCGPGYGTSSANNAGNAGGSGSVAMDPSGFSQRAADGLRAIGIDPYKLMDMVLGKHDGPESGGEPPTLVQQLEKIAKDFQKFMDFLDLFMMAMLGGLNLSSGLPPKLVELLKSLGIDPEKFLAMLMGAAGGGQGGEGCCPGAGQGSGGSEGGSPEVNQWGIPVAIALDGGPQGEGASAESGGANEATQESSANEQMPCCDGDDAPESTGGDQDRAVAY
jgi:hypothetical protein